MFFFQLVRWTRTHAHKHRREGNVRSTRETSTKTTRHRTSRLWWPMAASTNIQTGYGTFWHPMVVGGIFSPPSSQVLMEQKPSGGARPPAVLDGLSSFDPLDIDEARPLEDIDEATLERMKEEAWEEAMIDMDW
ncbi:hypothetical protein pclt_cds_539 [Pandoravirus celtis]|uniref:Uncharacterized protein n=1 Tax=Pandoravirus celtis TaxID=2568002 RepID=A0A4D6EII6_9VIRU|nr:hypothetical protein pclt_cds_539 [Pandoravirus celtis]